MRSYTPRTHTHTHTDDRPSPIRFKLFVHLGIDLGIRTVALHGKRAFGRDATPDLRRRRRRPSTRRAGRVTCARCKAGEEQTGVVGQQDHLCSFSLDHLDF